MMEKSFVIKNKLGLHARPAALMVQTAGKFKSKVKIFKDEQEVDGKSIMGLMTLAACAGTSLKIVADGVDEKEALDSMGRLIESGFIGFGGLVESTDLAHKLQRGRLDFILCSRRFEIVKRMDIPAHRYHLAFRRPGRLVSAMPALLHQFVPDC